MLEFAGLSPGYRLLLRLLDFSADSRMAGCRQTPFTTLPWQDPLKDT